METHLTSLHIWFFFSFRCAHTLTHSIYDFILTWHTFHDFTMLFEPQQPHFACIKFFVLFDEFSQLTKAQHFRIRASVHMSVTGYIFGADLESFCYFLYFALIAVVYIFVLLMLFSIFYSFSFRSLAPSALFFCTFRLNTSRQRSARKRVQHRS